MVIFILNTITIIVSIVFIFFNYYDILHEKKELETRIKKYIFGGFQLLGFGTLLVTLSLVGSRELEVTVETYLLIIFIIISSLIYIGIIILWNKLFLLLSSHISKKVVSDYKYKFKSISVYALIYSFGILFYMLYTAVFFS